MIVATVFLNLANSSHPAPVGLAFVLNPEVTIEDAHRIAEKASEVARTLGKATIQSVADAIVPAFAGKATLAELKIITLDTEIFG